MALINNWDLKEVNNAIYEEKGEGPRYVVSDLGATFGETGNSDYPVKEQSKGLYRIQSSFKK